MLPVENSEWNAHVVHKFMFRFLQQMHFLDCPLSVSPMVPKGEHQAGMFAHVVDFPQTGPSCCDHQFTVKQSGLHCSFQPPQHRHKLFLILPLMHTNDEKHSCVCATKHSPFLNLFHLTFVTHSVCFCLCPFPSIQSKN